MEQSAQRSGCWWSAGDSWFTHQRLWGHCWGVDCRSSLVLGNISWFGGNSGFFPFSSLLCLVYCILGLCHLSPSAGNKRNYSKIMVSPTKTFRKTLGGIEIYNGTGNNLVALNAELMRVNGERTVGSVSKAQIQLPQRINHWYYHDEPLSPDSGMRRIDTQKPIRLAVVKYLENHDVSQYTMQFHCNVANGDIITIQFGCESEVTREPIAMEIQARMEVDDSGRASIAEVITSAITEKLH